LVIGGEKVASFSLGSSPDIDVPVTSHLSERTDGGLAYLESPITNHLSPFPAMTAFPALPAFPALNLLAHSTEYSKIENAFAGLFYRPSIVLNRVDRHCR
jgi:hypothetical protein